MTCSRLFCRMFVRRIMSICMVNAVATTSNALRTSGSTPFRSTLTTFGLAALQRAARLALLPPCEAKMFFLP